MRKFRINEGVKTILSKDHFIGGVYELSLIDSDGDIWLKTKNTEWSYAPYELTEVFESDSKPLHKDTDLGRFSIELVKAFYSNRSIVDVIDGHRNEFVIRNSIAIAKELIKQLDNERDTI